MIDFSIIVPQRNSVHTLHRLFESIPNNDNIEIILVDNTPKPITKQDIGIDREYSLLWSAPERHAGGARNVGIEAAKGKWLIFADADDYFTEDAFKTFNSQVASQSDVIYFGVTGIYTDTGMYASRGEPYTNLVRNYLRSHEEMDIRLKFVVPWAKMVRRDFVMINNFRFDEVRASNDVFFATQVGYFAKTISAIDNPVYVATVSKGSLTKRNDWEVLHARYLVLLRLNAFYRSKGLDSFQGNVLRFLYLSSHFGIAKLLQMLREAVHYKQNIFFGCGNMVKGYFAYKKEIKKDSKYIVS